MNEYFLTDEEIDYEIQTSLDQLMKSRAKLQSTYDTQTIISPKIEEVIDYFTMSITNMKDAQDIMKA